MSAWTLWIVGWLVLRRWLASKEVFIPRLIVNEEELAKLPPDKRAEVDRLLAEYEETLKRNPLERFEPHSDAQREFLSARTDIVAAFAGNRFGKTTSLVIRALIELCPKEWIPSHLRSYKRWVPGEGKAVDGVHARIVCPDDTASLHGVLLPAFRKWAPRPALKGGSFDKAYDKQHRELRFESGSFVQFMTYRQDPDQFGGSAMHFIGYDEPPPEEIREECLWRLSDYGGYELFAMTPLKVNTSWIRREIYKRRGDPDKTVVRGSIHDNPTISSDEKKRVLGGTKDKRRRAREFGDFTDFGGLVYPDFERAVVDAPTSEHVQGLDVVVGIDPGIRKAAMVWIGFDSDNVGLVFAEQLLESSTPREYAAAIRAVNARWGISEEPLYVIDPSARNRAQVNAENVQSALQREGIFSKPGQNQVEAGITEVQTRLATKGLLISSECVGLREEADEYAMEDREDDVFSVVATPSQSMDALRYACMERAWDAPEVEERPEDRRMDEAWPVKWSRPRSEAHPLGALV